MVRRSQSSSSDIGRPLSDITHRLDYDGSFAEDVMHVLATLQPVEREVASVDGRWYLMRISAYRTTEDRIDGAVLNFIDVTERRAAQEQVRARDERLRLVAESTRDFAVITLDAASNALKFTPPGGTIHVRLTRDGPWALLEVQDTGRGIEPGFLGHVFDMFQQGDHKPTTRRDGGLGIGLALVKSLAELHGGSVEANSEGPGKGAVFRVRLPLLEGALGSDGPGFQLVSRQALAGRRILLVDDDLHTLETLGELLGARAESYPGASELVGRREVRQGLPSTSVRRILAAEKERSMPSPTSFVRRDKRLTPSRPSGSLGYAEAMTPPSDVELCERAMLAIWRRLDEHDLVDERVRADLASVLEPLTALALGDRPQRLIKTLRLPDPIDASHLYWLTRRLLTFVPELQAMAAKPQGDGPPPLA